RNVYLFFPTRRSSDRIGSFFSDLYLGFPAFMFATLIIKGIMGYIAGKFLYSDNGAPSAMRKFLGILLSGLWMVVGYYIFEVIILDRKSTRLNSSHVKI